MKLKQLMPCMFLALMFCSQIFARSIETLEKHFEKEITPENSVQLNVDSLRVNEDSLKVNEDNLTTSLSNFHIRCPDEFVAVGIRCYYFNSKPTSWYRALQSCISLESYLAHPANLFENELLKLYISHVYGSDPVAWWFGGTDDPLEGNWIWTDTMRHLTFTDWCNKEPNNYGYESCLSFNSECRFRWNDRSCNYDQYGYICQQ
ncbi:Fc fragment of IgE, low affinity II, receptor for (CD23) [Chamberlinius hualienensis]